MKPRVGMFAWYGNGKSELVESEIINVRNNNLVDLRIYHRQNEVCELEQISNGLEIGTWRYMYKPTTSRQKKIVKAIDAKGYTVENIEWEPIGGCLEMAGNEGGWAVYLRDSSDVIVGYNVDEVLEYIDKYSPEKSVAA